MKFILKILFVILCLSLFNSCSKKDENVSIIEKDEIELQMIDSYTKGLDALEKGDALFAAKKFNEAELLFPQSKWAPKSSLMAAYSFYSQDYFGDAIFQLQLFMKTYPNDKRMSYANFLLAMCYYDSIIDERKDLKPLIRAEEQFKYVINNYPNTDFAIDAKFKISLIKEILASKEIYLGRHYIKKKKWIAAINRFKKVIEDYDTTIYVEEALHRLVEIHYKIGLVDESKKYANLLGYNYLSGEWYARSYKVFNKNYEDPFKKAKKKRGNLIKKKFGNIFN